MYELMMITLSDDARTHTGSKASIRLLPLRQLSCMAGGGVLVHPHIATVTYLSATGGGTLVVDRVSPMSPDVPLEVPGSRVPDVARHPPATR